MTVSLTSIAQIIQRNSRCRSATTKKGILERLVCSRLLLPMVTVPQSPVSRDLVTSPSAPFRWRPIRNVLRYANPGKQYDVPFALLFVLSLLAMSDQRNEHPGANDIGPLFCCISKCTFVSRLTSSFKAGDSLVTVAHAFELCLP